MSWESVLKYMKPTTKERIDRVMGDGVPRTGKQLVDLLIDLNFKHTPTKKEAGLYMNSSPKYDIVSRGKAFTYQIKEEFRND